MPASEFGGDAHSMQPVELIDTPFFPQTRNQCGPAALATVLQESGIAIKPWRLTEYIFLPGREGSLQVEILATARRLDRIPVLLEGEPAALHLALRNGKPVLVLQNLGTRRFSLWHYSVLVGYEPEKTRYILRSGKTERKVMSGRRFLESWDRADNWAMVLLEPGDMIPAVSEIAYLEAVAGFEQAGYLNSAISGYLAATAKWPASDLPWIGLGNSYYAKGDLQKSRDALIRAIENNPKNPVAYNNLATVLSEQGSREAALDRINEAKSLLNPSSGYEQVIKQTYRDIEMRNSDCTFSSRCPEL